MAENGWYPMPPVRRSQSPVVKCECCYSVKPRDKQRPCTECQAAGCKQEYGSWKRGEECPGRTRRRKKSRSGIVIRKVLKDRG